MLERLIFCDIDCKCFLRALHLHSVFACVLFQNIRDCFIVELINVIFILDIQVQLRNLCIIYKGVILFSTWIIIFFLQCIFFGFFFCDERCYLWKQPLCSFPRQCFCQAATLPYIFGVVSVLQCCCVGKYHSFICLEDFYIWKGM